MKYRIKIKTFKTGRKEYSVQVKTFCFWAWLWSKGESSLLASDEFNSREEALRRIDLHHAGNSKKQKIEFELVNKFRRFLKYKKIAYGRLNLYVPRHGYTKEEIEAAEKRR